MIPKRPLNYLQLLKKMYRKMRNLLFLWIFTFAQVGLYAQTQGIVYTAVGKGVATTFLTDYQCLGINTSALGWGSGYEKKE